MSARDLTQGAYLGENQKEIASRVKNLNQNGDIYAAEDLTITNKSGDLTITNSTGTGDNLIIDGSAGGVSIGGQGGVLIGSTLSCTSNTILFSNLPTSDPATAGELWSNAGVVTVSAG